MTTMIFNKYKKELWTVKLEFYLFSWFLKFVVVLVLVLMIGDDDVEGDAIGSVRVGSGRIGGKLEENKT